ncbi:hypothetical protein [Streptomyces sp. NPDC046727]|uniref:hypothetical protein n=1 Tax=Streptomyces sp. NPDC046727 TaxID=3155373 RepID=UPI0033D867DA
MLTPGHRRVLLLGGRPDQITAQGRVRGCLGAHRARGIGPARCCCTATSPVTPGTG